MKFTFDKRAFFSSLSVVIYIILFAVLSYTSGHGMHIISALPVLTVGFCYGWKAGVSAALLSYPINLYMNIIFGIDLRSMLGGTGILGTIVIIVQGALVGCLRDLSVRLRTANTNFQKEILERKRAVDELSQIKNRLEKLVDTSLDPILITDGAGCIIRVNSALLDMLGFAEEEIIGKTQNSFARPALGTYESTTGEGVTIDEAFSINEKAMVARLLEKEKISDFRSYYVRKDNRVVPVTQNIVLLRNEQGELIWAVGILRNITQQRKAELNLIRAKEAAEETSLAKGSFLANMSHEIRTPMNGVVGFIDMLLETSLTEEQQDYAHTIQRSAEALLSLINDILDFSKIEAGKIAFEEIDYDIEMLAYDVCELIRPRTADKQIEILCRIDDNLPARVKGDPHRYRQVLLNLMSNAAKFTEAGEIELVLVVEDICDDTVTIHAQVRDTGIGIPQDKLESVFNIFEQADSSTSRRFGGTGLGLAICRHIARLMGGNVWAESATGRGSTFHFTAVLKQSAEEHFRRIIPVSLSGKKVLITDDSRANLDIIMHFMSAAGIAAKECMSGNESLRLLADARAAGEPFDICILDITMPDIDGYKLARTIRSRYGDRLPLLAFSSAVIKGSAKECQEAGFSGFLPKPVNRIKLFKMMERLIAEALHQDDGFIQQHAIATQHSIREAAKHSVSILLAEDNPVNQKLTVMLLAKAGYKVTVAGNGKEAVELFSADPHQYDIIFMDIQMPELNGFDATQALRARGFGDIPIVAMTAQAMKGDREKCLQAGMNDYIAKPIKRDAVFETLRKWVFERPTLLPGTN